METCQHSLRESVSGESFPVSFVILLFTQRVKSKITDRYPEDKSLFERARTDAWRVDGGPGFVYITDFEGTPVVHERMHWVVCEGVCAAAALRRALLDDGHGEIKVKCFSMGFN